MTSTSEQLVLQYVAGDIRSFETLYQRHRNELKSFISHRISNRQKSEDIFQLVWEKVIKSAPSLSKQISSSKSQFALRPYLFRIAANAVIDHWRRENVVAYSFDEYQQDGDDSHTEIVDANGPEEVMSAIELSDCVTSKLSQLKPEVLEPFYLTRDETLSYAEAADVLSLNVETLRSRVKKALMVLRPCLEKFKYD